MVSAAMPAGMTRGTADPLRKLEAWARRVGSGEGRSSDSARFRPVAGGGGGGDDEDDDDDDDDDDDVAAAEERALWGALRGGVSRL